jgi:AcrR family transcriptional regulator
MPRSSVFDRERIVGTAARLAARHGPGAATIGRIASELGAPTGSIYHRFASRDVLLGEVWLAAAESFQRDFGAVLAGAPARDAAIAAALFVPARVRRQADEARVLMLHRREDFVAGNWPDELAARARALGRSAEAGLRDASARLFARTDAAALRTLRYAVVDLPMAAVLPHLRAKQSPPPIVDDLVRTAATCVIDALLAKSARPPTTEGQS